ncbi:hypothetical protein [Miltoncostaea oceani]|uniref:hypothetical protein n=1 Tax=Miltoncostaea oceani TaxID=2843216 RepID=UPI001C3E0126|nr:hypothetical protein [Miltoncostaea oceani]
MPLVTPKRRESQGLPAETCGKIEIAAEQIGDPEIVAWLQRHYAARSSNDGFAIRPYDKDAAAYFRAGLLHSPDGGPALILADGRAWHAWWGELTELPYPVALSDYLPRRPRLRRLVRDLAAVAPFAVIIYLLLR